VVIIIGINIVGEGLVAISRGVATAQSMIDALKLEGEGQLFKFNFSSIHLVFHD